ncbi:MAG TPA: phosphodiester glycosidase family protein [Abditibacteriaceae bacterium]|jgi:exopolysaccharide biosynthesis protein
MRRWFFPFLLCAGFFLLAAPRFVRWLRQNRSPWNEIARGVEMRRFASIEKGGAANIVAFRVAANRVHIVAGKATDAAGWRVRGKAIVAINGAFFDNDGKSLGVRICDGALRTRLSPAGGGVFQVRRGQAEIVPAKGWQRRRRTTQAVQCSPRLVVGGKLKTFKEQWARRTALGVARDGRVVIAVADGAISFQDWAKIWQSRDGLNCRDALSLDGGGSTQLSVNSARAKLEVGGATDVPDAVIIR